MTTVKNRFSEGQVYPWYSNKIRRCGKSVDWPVDGPIWRNCRGYKRYSTAEFKIYMCICGNTWRSFKPDFLEDRKGRKKCRSKHKKKYCYMLSRDLFHYHHKREFSKRIHEELLPIAWHPNRVYDWCFDEEEKGFLGGNMESRRVYCVTNSKIDASWAREMY